jgi:hypothetical protein
VVPSRAPLLCGATRKAAIALDYRRCFSAGGFPAVEWSELLGIRDPGEPIVSSQLANDRAILLFHRCLIVLSISARTRILVHCGLSNVRVNANGPIVAPYREKVPESICHKPWPSPRR